MASQNHSNFLPISVGIKIRMSCTAVCMPHRLWAGWQKISWLDSCQGEQNCLFLKPTRQIPGPIRPPTLWALGVLHLAVKWSEQEADHSSPSSAETENEYRYTSVHTYKSIILIKPTGHVMHQQFNIQQLYAVPTLYLCVLYLSENKQRLVPLTA
jgi:hypothetical protein